MPITFIKSQPGDTFNTTVALIKSLALAGSKSPDVKIAAINILSDAGINDGRARNPSAVALARWIGREIQFFRDPKGTETLQTPQKTIEFGYGDCDDMSILLAAMLMSIGIEVRFRIVGKDRPGHIYVEALVEAGWLGLDPVARAGIDPHPSTLTTFKIEGYRGIYV